MEIPNVPESDAVVPRKRGRPKKSYPEKKMESMGIDLSDVPKVASELEKIDYRPMVKVMDHSLQNKWMQQYLVPGKFKLVIRDTKGKYKAGKVIFVVDGVRSNMDVTGKAICLCVCDVLVDADGAIVRKPNYTAYSKGSSGSKRTKMYQQVFIPMEMASDVISAMSELSGSDMVKVSQAAHVEAKEVIKQSEEDRFMAENFDRVFGRLY